MEIDEDYAVAVARPRLGIPAIAPLILEARLRTAVDEEGHRVARARRETERLHHVSVDGFAVPALEAELLVVAHRALTEHVLIHGSQAARRSARHASDVKICGTPEARERVDHGILQRRVVRDLARADNFVRRATGYIDCVQRLLADVVRRGEQLFAIRRDVEPADRAVPGLGECANRTRVRIAQHDVEAIGLEAGAILREIRHVAVLQEHGLCVPRRMVGGEILCGRRTIDRRLEEIEVGGPRLAAAGDACGEDDGAAIRSERELFIAAERLGRHIRIETARHVDGRAGSAIRPHDGDEQM